MKPITIIGGGLAGCEAAWQAAESGIMVKLFEMRPGEKTPAHNTDYLAELLCSNSLRSRDPENPHGLLKEELRRLNSLLIRCADESAIPAGKALAVNRNQFGSLVTAAIESHPNISLVREEITRIPEESAIIATGPLTSDSLSRTIQDFTGKENLYFYDAISPIIDAHTINYKKVFFGNRYEKDGNDYVNCPLTEEEYKIFYQNLMAGEMTPIRDFEDPKFFEGCMPVEVIAQRGAESLTFGPMRPVGFSFYNEKGTPYAIVQLRKENREGTMYNMVGFQTRLKHSCQESIFRLIPGLEKAEFHRFGSMHKNTYINSPELLCSTFESKKKKGLFFAGQITGVEGYVESIASGCIAGIMASEKIKGKLLGTPPETTAIGALIKYITSKPKKGTFQPMNINLGLFPSLDVIKMKKKDKRRLISQRALGDLERWIQRRNISARK